MDRDDTGEVQLEKFFDIMVTQPKEYVEMCSFLINKIETDKSE